MRTFKEEIQNNMNFNGGGLAVNITGKYESNRHAIAKAEKVTFGEAAKRLRTKKGGNLDITAKELLNLYWSVKGEPEWHHAGFLPKSYGGGMKKTYFLDDYITKEEVLSFYKKCSKMNTAALLAETQRKTLEERQNQFLRQHATRFARVLNKPDHCIITGQEMEGKYGWFDSTYKSYNLPEYFSGWKFETEEKRNEYFKIQ
jgi:hypothetical protein